MSLRSAKISFCTSHFTCDCWDILSSPGQSALHHLFLHLTCLYFPSGHLFPLPLLSWPMPSPQVTQSQCIIAFPSGKCANFDQRSTYRKIFLFALSIILLDNIEKRTFRRNFFVLYFCGLNIQHIGSFWYDIFKVGLQILLQVVKTLESRKIAHLLCAVMKRRQNKNILSF